MALSVIPQQHGKTGDADAYGNQREGETMLRLVGAKGDDHGEGESGSPGGHRVQLGFDVGVVEGFYDCGCEVGVAVGGDDEAEVHEAVMIKSADVRGRKGEEGNRTRRR